MKSLFIRFVDASDHVDSRQSRRVQKMKIAFIEQSKEPEFYAELIALLKKHSRPDDQDF
jgi:hypothetical protein